MPLEIAGEAHIAPGLTFIRPLREVLPDEIAMYNRVKELRVLQVPSIVSAEQPNASIDRLTENLLVGLQRSFPATMGAVSKTAYKVQTRTTDGLVGPFQNQPEPTEELAFFKCAICYSYIHPDDADWRRRRTVESLDDLNRDVDPHKEDKLLAGIEETGELFRHLCYGCQNVARDLVDRKGPLPAEGADNGRLDFPPYGVKAIASNREKMKVMIGEFLIEDDEEDGA